MSQTLTDLVDLLEECKYTGRLSTIEELVNVFHVDVNHIDSRGETALCVACHAGQWENANFLIEHGAHVNQKDRQGYTPLHHACENAHKDVAKLLLKHRADVNSEDANGRTPLFDACEARSWRSEIAT